MDYRENFAKFCLDRGGDVRPLIIPSSLTNGTGLMNPTILNHDNRLFINIRHVNYTFYHSEKKIFQHAWGPLNYVHPENDITLRTWNYFGELNKNLDILSYGLVDTTDFDTYEPLSTMIGLEDARLVNWNDSFYLSGVRRDTTPNGVGRMELSRVEGSPSTMKEVYRSRIEPPNNPDSYCEKNWMPIIDKPYHYVKWSKPTEVVKVNIEKGTSEVVHLEKENQIPVEPRGGSQVIPWKDGYIALTHEVDLTKHETDKKDAVYRHRFIVWDKDFNVQHFTNDFSLMNGHVEFCVGMCYYGDDILITYGFQDNAAYVAKLPITALEEFVYG